MSKISKKSLFVKRSRAAKKGWETRRKNEQRSQSRKGTSTKRDNATNSRSKKSRKQPTKQRGRIQAKKEPTSKQLQAKVTRIQRELAKEKAKNRRREKSAEYRERSAIRKAEKLAKRAPISEEKLIERLVRGGAGNMAIVNLWPPEERERVKSLVVQARLDFSAVLYNDVRFDAFELADDFDWDISDVFEDWSYDAEGAA
jgi:hypothetical protein